jgi:hypothetical protein
MANVEALNKQLGLLINTFMNDKEEETKKRFREWTKIIDFVRTELNKIRKKKLKKPLILMISQKFRMIKLEILNLKLEILFLKN